LLFDPFLYIKHTSLCQFVQNGFNVHGARTRLRPIEFDISKWP